MTLLFPARCIFHKTLKQVLWRRTHAHEDEAFPFSQHYGNYPECTTMFKPWPRDCGSIHFPSQACVTLVTFHTRPCGYQSARTRPTLWPPGALHKHTHTHTHTHRQTHTHTDTHTHTHTHTDTNTHTRTHTHTHTHTRTHTHTHTQTDTHTHTHTHTHVGFYGLWGLSIGVMVFILNKLYVLLPYTYPTPKLSPHRRRCIYIFPQKNSLCMIYKHFKLWGHWKCPHKSPSPCNTYVIPMSLYKCVSS